MSKAAPAAAPAPEGAPEGGGSKKKLLIIIIAAVVVLAGGGGAAFFMMSKKKEKKPEADEHAEEEDAHAAPVNDPKHPPVFAALEPFVVNLGGPTSERFLQIAISFEVKDGKMADMLKNFTPILRSRILMVLSSKDSDVLGTVEGKQELMDELLDMARETVKGPGKNKGIVDVHFTSFVIQ